jgi:hypothetical protein
MPYQPDGDDIVDDDVYGGRALPALHLSPNAVNQFAVPPSYSAVPSDCDDSNGTSKMCEACNELDAKIEHYKKVVSAMTDQLTIDRVMALIAELEGKKSKLHREKK